MESVKQKGLVVVISGPAGSGKGTVVDLLMQACPEEMALSVSATTRSPRPGEVDGKSYYFITKEDFVTRINEGKMLEYNCYCDNYYGTPADMARRTVEEGKNLILEIDVNGAMQVRESYPEAVLIMLLPPSARVQEERLRKRGTETDEVIARRLARAREEIKRIPSYDYVVYNHTGRTKDAMNDILAIIKAERCSLRRNADAEQRFLCD